MVELDQGVADDLAGFDQLGADVVAFDHVGGLDVVTEKDGSRVFGVGPRLVDVHRKLLGCGISVLRQTVMQIHDRLDDFQIKLVESGSQAERADADAGFVVVALGDILELRIEVEFAALRVGVADGDARGVFDFRLAALLQQPDEARVELRRKQETAQRAGHRLHRGGSARSEAECIPAD